jgi:hypothetical protein
VSYRLERRDGTDFVTGSVRSVRGDDGVEFIAETSPLADDAARFPTHADAYGFRLRLALDGYIIREVDDAEGEAGRECGSGRTQRAASTGVGA